MLAKSIRILRLSCPRETFETLHRRHMRRRSLRQLPLDKSRYNPDAETEQVIPLITPAQMRAMEQRYFDETGTASIDLMETAAEALLSEIRMCWLGKRRASIACGPGGNGGDGYALARLLVQRLGWDCALYPSEPPKTPDAIENRRRALEMGIPERSPGEGEAPDLWVDALYGTGLSRAPEGAAAAPTSFVGRRARRNAEVAALAAEMAARDAEQKAREEEAKARAEEERAAREAERAEQRQQLMDIREELRKAREEKEKQHAAAEADAAAATEAATDENDES